MRPRGVADAHTVEIPWPPKNLSMMTLMKGLSQVLVYLGVRDRNLVGKCTWTMARKVICMFEVPVPQTDTGSQEENSKANGRRVVKELGKLTP